jgi:hypothetical protein
MKPRLPDLAEAQFEAYLEERGIAGGDDHHPDLGGKKRPDYRISRGSSAVIVEIKGFTTSRMQDRLEGSTGTVILSDRDIYGTPRNKIRKAMRQLRPYAHRGEALVIALANPRRLRTPTEDAQETIVTLHGNRAFVMPISRETGDANGEGQWVYDKDGVFGGGLHRYISGVITLHERTYAQDAVERWHHENRHRWAGIGDRRELGVAYLQARDDALENAEATPGSYRFVRVFETLSAAEAKDAVPVPRDLFNGPRDEFWTINLDTGRVEREI